MDPELRCRDQTSRCGIETFVMAYQKVVRNAAVCETIDTHFSLFAISNPLCYIILQSALFLPSAQLFNMYVRSNYRETIFGPKYGAFRASYLHNR